MKTWKGDLLVVPDVIQDSTLPLVLMHQVNNQGIMGAGIALSIRQKWPKVYKEYLDLCNQFTSEELLGKAQLVEIRKNVYVANIFGQCLQCCNEMPTKYDKVRIALEELKTHPVMSKFCALFMPKFMGCCRGGGDWDTYLNIVLSVFPNVNVVDYAPGSTTLIMVN